ncbi:MAG: amidohydrolase family protein, partial [Bacteroidetes bacterium]|nr:amidohydrolase family protein [Bacteroidota bacterium]
INSHDHLDFNLFPSLGNTTYANYRQWGHDIHTNNKDEIRSVLDIPLHLRTRWGVYKNLLNGFTTVVNHGNYLPIAEPTPITVFQNCNNLHSVGFERNWRWKLNRPQKNDWPIVLHVGEGTDKTAHREITRLLRWNLRRRPLIGVHGVAMTEKQAARFKALVWCPASNYFLLDQTAPIKKLCRHTQILFGTDSTLTTSWDAWAQIRMALREVEEKDILPMLTTNPANAWNLTDRGKIEKGLRADLLITRNKSLATLTPDDILLVIHHGEIVLFDPVLKNELPQKNLQQTVPGGKYVAGDITGLIQQIKTYTNGYASPLLFC